MRFRDSFSRFRHNGIDDACPDRAALSLLPIAPRMAAMNAIERPHRRPRALEGLAEWVVPMIRSG